jgi:hypothetical protein
MWQVLLIQLAMVIGLKLLAKSQNEPEPTELEKQIITTPTREGIVTLFLGPVLSEIAGSTLPSEVAPVVEGLAQAKSKEEIVAVVNNPQTKMGLFDGIGNFLADVLGGIFGKK